MKYCLSRLWMLRSVNEQGATATEYALLISGIALTLVAATALLGGKLSDALELMSTAMFP